MDSDQNDYYGTLAERIIHRGIDPEILPNFASYKLGKSWEDLKNALSKDVGGGSFDYDSQLAIITGRISDVLDIDTTQSFVNYQRKLEAIPQPT